MEYNRLMESHEGIALPYEPAWSRAVYHLYVIRADNRDAMIRDLHDAGIGTGIHYPIPLHMQKAYTALDYSAGDFPVAEKSAREIVSLPMFPHLTAQQQGRVAEQVYASISKSLQHGRSEEKQLVSAEHSL
jgi:dTDP-4-amino-4,6-dideoxygalactose transaminase